VPLWLLVLLMSFALAYLLTPVVKTLALRVGAVAKPGDRSVHTHPTPHLGGLAIYVAFAATVVLVSGWPEAGTLAILGCGFLVVLLGALDDFHELSPQSKFLGQVVMASLLVGLGVRIHFITNPFGGGVLYLGDWSFPLSVIWVVAVMNVVNLSDGLDGLAAGISTIAALAALFVATRMGFETIVVLTAALAGSALGFLPHNFNPAKIFMGDAGAMFLGFVLAAVAMQGALKQTTAVALLVPTVALGLPIADTALSIYRRIRAGRSIGQADKGHLHHRLLALGLTQKQAVLLMWAVSAWLGVSAVLLSEMSTTLGLVLAMALGALGLLAFVAAVAAGALPWQQGRNLPK